MREYDTKHQRYAFGSMAATVAIAVFSVDTFTDIEGAIAVLYVLTLLLAAQVVERQGLIALTAGCIAMTLFSFLLTHGTEPGLQTLLRLLVAIAALGVTAALLLRNERIRSELVASHSALQQSEARYRSIFARTRVALWERDYSSLRAYLMQLKADGVTEIAVYAKENPGVINACIDMIEIVAANEAAIELLGDSATKSPKETVPRFIPEDSVAFVTLLQSIMDGARCFEDVTAVVNDRGEIKMVMLAIAFPEDGSAFDRVVVSMVDVTQREEARKALSEAQAELSRASKAATVGVLSASLAHDLNQPLGAIVVNAQTLMRWLDRSPPDVASAKRSAERILRDGKRASDIIGNTRSLLLASPKEPEIIDLRVLINETMNLMEHELQRERIRVDVVHSINSAAVVGARIELQQVLINLVSNAIQAISTISLKDRRINIALAEVAGAEAYSISIKDNGNGLSAEAKEKIFTPFFTTKIDGMGMGLSICKSTLEAIGGSLEGRDHPDGGAVFEITLPKGECDVAA